MSRVALVVWPIGQEGGIATHAAATSAALSRRGHDVEIVRVVYNRADHGTVDPHDMTTTGGTLRVGGRRLSIVDDCLDQTVGVLDTFDVVAFLHPAPHLSDSAQAVANWPALYLGPRGEKIAAFSDVYAADYYPWIVKVADHFRPIAYNSAAARHAAEVLGRESVDVFTHPWVDRPEAPDDTVRDVDLVWPHAWRSWKGIRKVVDLVVSGALDGSKVVLFGDGRERYSARKDPDVWGPLTGRAEVPGVVPPEVVWDTLRRARFAVDLTGQSPKYVGHYNRATIEPILYGAVPVVGPELVAPHSPIPPDVVHVADRDDLAATIAPDIDLTDTREAGHAWAVETFTDEAVEADYLR